MASITLHNSFNFLSAQDWDSVVTGFNVSSITIRNGTHRQVFDGSFNFSGTNVSGTVTSTQLFDSDTLLYSISGLNLSVSQVQLRANTLGDTQETNAYGLRGNDTVNGSAGEDGIVGYKGALKSQHFASNQKGVARDAKDYFVFNNKTKTLFFDPEGSGKAAKVKSRRSATR